MFAARAGVAAKTAMPAHKSTEQIGIFNIGVGLIVGAKSAFNVVRRAPHGECLWNHPEAWQNASNRALDRGASARPTLHRGEGYTVTNPRRMRLFAVGAVVALTLLTPGVGPSAAENPLMQPSTLPFGALPFDRINDSDYLPAIEAGMLQQIKEVDAIANNPARPTFDNTLVAMEKSGRLLHRAMGAFTVQVETNSDPALLRVRQAIAPEYAAHQDAIYLNPKLFARVQAIYENVDRLKLDPESRHLVVTYYRRFLHAGADLRTAKQMQLRQINQRLATLQTAFERKLLAGTAAGALIVRNKSQLAGLSDGAIAAAQQAATTKGDPGGYLIPLQNTTQQPALTLLQDRATRRDLFENSWTRTEKNDADDTRSTIAQMAKLRAEKAALLGYPDFAAYQLTQEMAQTPAAVQTFLRGLIGPTRAVAAEEASEIQAQIDKDGRHFQLEPYDWNYYAEQIRKAKYHVDDNEIRPYFELNDVLQNGLFYAANQTLRHHVQRAPEHSGLAAGRAGVRSLRQERRAARFDVLRFFQARQ